MKLSSIVRLLQWLFVCPFELAENIYEVLHFLPRIEMTPEGLPLKNHNFIQKTTLDQRPSYGILLVFCDCLFQYCQIPLVFTGLYDPYATLVADTSLYCIQDAFL